MSETAQGPNWWMASDGRWYPPELHPHWPGGVPPPQPDYRAPGETGEPSGATDGLPSFSTVVPPETWTTRRPSGPTSIVVDGGGGGPLEAVVEGPQWGMPLVFHHGSPFAAVPWPFVADAASSRGLRLVTCSRPGYAGSRAWTGRTVVDTAADVAAVLDALGQDRFVTIGWSGGGPHALACAAALGGGCAAAATMSSLAPFGAEGLDWRDGMPPSRASELEMAARREPELTAILEAAAAALAPAGRREVGAALAPAPLAPEDVASLAEEPAEALGEALRSGLARGVSGWRDDYVAVTGDWGFDLGQVRCPVTVWHGGKDAVAPPGHAAWLADHLPSGRLRLRAGEGHVSLLLHHLGAALDELIAPPGGEGRGPGPGRPAPTQA